MEDYDYTDSTGSRVCLCECPNGRNGEHEYDCLCTCRACMGEYADDDDDGDPQELDFN